MSLFGGKQHAGMNFLKQPFQRDLVGRDLLTQNCTARLVRRHVGLYFILGTTCGKEKEAQFPEAPLPPPPPLFSLLQRPPPQKNE